MGCTLATTRRSRARMHDAIEDSRGMTADTLSAGISQYVSTHVSQRSLLFSCRSMLPAWRVHLRALVAVCGFLAFLNLLEAGLLVCVLPAAQHAMHWPLKGLAGWAISKFVSWGPKGS